MADPKQSYYDKRGQLLVKNLRSRHFEAYYCRTKQEALEQALSLIPAGAVIGWGGALSAQQIGLIDAVSNGNYSVIDRDKCTTLHEREKAMKACLSADVFLSGANALSIDGQMVNIDGNGNRVGAIIYGPDSVVIIAGMNKVMDSLEAAVNRARTIAAPMNQQRFELNLPCSANGVCADCKSEDCICNQIVITRHCRPSGRIKFVVVGEDLGL